MEIEVVYNTCYGGFSISKRAIDRMIELGSDIAREYAIIHEKYRWSKDSYHPDIKRNDSILVRVVKELGPDANGYGARLAIAKIDLDDLFSIDDYDGKETVVIKSTEIY